MPRLSLILSPSMKQKAILKCGLCKTPMGEEVTNENITLVALFGKTRYGACPICHNANVDSQDKDWQVKVDKWIEKTIKKLTIKNKIVSSECWIDYGVSEVGWGW